VTAVAVVTAVAAVAHPVGVVTTRQQQPSRILLMNRVLYCNCIKRPDKKQ
jgi:hypothetical protein